MIAIVFFTVINLLIVPYLFSIIIVIYNELRERNQETVETIQIITAEEKKVNFKEILMR